MADGAIGMRPSAILRRPSIFKSSSLAKRAGGRRVFLSRRKITHCPLSGRPSSLSRLLPARCRRRFSCSPLLVHHRWPKSLSFSLFRLPRRPRYLLSFYRAISGKWAKICGREVVFERKEEARRDYCSSISLRNYVAQRMFFISDL